LAGSSPPKRRGRVHEPAKLPGFVAMADDRIVGVITYRADGDEIEVVTLNSYEEGRGIGSALIDRVAAVGRELRVRRLWLITTNDNTWAMRFYQRRGSSLAAAYPRAIAASRQLKPAISLVGNDGIPIRDELEFEFSLI
jgi:GNAT superfamily N-acetyltransferase